MGGNVARSGLWGNVARSGLQGECSQEWSTGGM